MLGITLAFSSYKRRPIVERIDEFFAPGYFLHHPGSPDLLRGTASFDL